MKALLTLKFYLLLSLLTVFTPSLVLSSPLTTTATGLSSDTSSANGNVALTALIGVKLKDAMAGIWGGSQPEESTPLNLPKSFVPGPTHDAKVAPMFFSNAEEGVKVGGERITVLEELTRARTDQDRVAIAEKFRATGGQLKARDIDYFTDPFKAEAGKQFSIKNQGYTDVGSFNPVLSVPPSGYTEYFDGHGISAMPLCGIEPGPFNVGRASGFCPKGQACTTTKTGNTVNLLLSKEGQLRAQVIKDDVNMAASCKPPKKRDKKPRNRNRKDW